LLNAAPDCTPAANDPFLVVDESLTVCALSRHAEKLLDVAETDAVNKHLAEFLVPGDAEAPPSQNLAALLSRAARGEGPARDVVVRPANTFGVRYWARIGPCGPTSAAILVLADVK
jgi:hypothetical protein